MSNQRNLKAFVRYDGSGRVVAGSLVLRKKKPKVGRWEEILTYECCGDSPTTTTSTTQSGPVLQWLYSTIDNPQEVCSSTNILPFTFNGNSFCDSTVINLDTSNIGNGNLFYAAYQNNARLWVVTSNSQADIWSPNPNCVPINCSSGTTTTTSTSNTTTTTTTYFGTYYNAGLASNGATAVCNNQGPYNLPLTVDPNVCSNGSITLASGTYADYGIPNNSTIYINLNNGNVIQVQTFGSSVMSFGCTSCSGTTTTTTTTASVQEYRISSTGCQGCPNGCSEDLNSGTYVYAQGPAYATPRQLYTDSGLTTPFIANAGNYKMMQGWPSGQAYSSYVEGGQMLNANICQ